MPMHVIYNDLGVDVASLVPKACHLACLLRPIWQLVGPSSDSGGLGSTRKRPWGSRHGFLSILGGPPFGSFLRMRVCRLCFIMTSGFESGCLGFQNHALGVGSVAKTSFSGMLGLC